MAISLCHLHSFPGSLRVRDTVLGTSVSRNTTSRFSFQEVDARLSNRPSSEVYGVVQRNAPIHLRSTPCCAWLTVCRISNGNCCNFTLLKIGADHSAPGPRKRSVFQPARRPLMYVRSTKREAKKVPGIGWEGLAPPSKCRDYRRIQEAGLLVQGSVEARYIQILYLDTRKGLSRDTASLYSCPIADHN